MGFETSREPELLQEFELEPKPEPDPKPELNEPDPALNDPEPEPEPEPNLKIPESEPKARAEKMQFHGQISACLCSLKANTDWWQYLNNNNKNLKT